MSPEFPGLLTAADAMLAVPGAGNCEKAAYSGDSDHPYWFIPITCST
jgi:hypothetical protein